MIGGRQRSKVWWWQQSENKQPLFGICHNCASMQATDASTSQTALNISAAFSDFAQLQVVPDGRNLHLLAPADNGSLVSKDTPIASARKLLDTLRQASSSLTAAMNYPVSDQRAVTLYKESSQHEHAIHKVSYPIAQSTFVIPLILHSMWNRH